ILLGYSINYPAGKGLNHLPSDVLDGYVNDQRVVSGETVSVKANFEGKVLGNTDRIPHTGGRPSSGAGSTYVTLQTPTGQWSENTQVSYDNIVALDGVLHSRSLTYNGAMVQHLFSFNLIRLME